LKEAIRKISQLSSLIPNTFTKTGIDELQFILKLFAAKIWQDFKILALADKNYF
jgi:hypothetical protein